MFSSLKATRFFCAQTVAAKEKTIIDLGSGWGTLALAVARKNPNKQVIGYELSPIPLYFSQLLKLLFRQKNLHFKQIDFIMHPLDKNTLYLCYLHPEGMQKLTTKVQTSPVKPLIISSTFALPNLKHGKRSFLNDLYKTPFYFYHTL